jgi:hypothetical protein
MEKQVLITWRDTPEYGEMFTYVAIDPNWVDKEDDDGIFFYFDNEEEYQDALINGTEEFTMREYA